MSGIDVPARKRLRIATCELALNAQHRTCYLIAARPAKHSAGRRWDSVLAIRRDYWHLPLAPLWLSNSHKEDFIPPLQLDSPEALREYVGREIATTGWMQLTQERIDRFADVTEDRQWIHIDRERAERESPFHGTVAHGFLTLSLISHLSKQAFEIRGGMRLAVNYGLNRVRFPSPVRADSMIRARFALESLKDVKGALEATYLVTIEAEGASKPCCVAEWIVRYYHE